MRSEQWPFGISICPPGGSHIDMVYVYVPAFWALFRKIWYSDWGVFIRDEGAQIT